jgi:hypothetical protein
MPEYNCRSRGWINLPAAVSEDFDVWSDRKQTLLIIAAQTKTTRPRITDERLCVSIRESAMRFERLAFEEFGNLGEKVACLLFGYVLVPLCLINSSKF